MGRRSRKGKLIETSLLEAAMVFQEATLIESYLQEGKPNLLVCQSAASKLKMVLCQSMHVEIVSLKVFALYRSRRVDNDRRFIGPRERVANHEI